MKKIFIVFYAFFSISHVLAQSKTEFSCITEKHTILVDKVDSATYRYRSWNKPKSTDVKPDMELKSKEVLVGGTGACRNTAYSFKVGKVDFILDNNINCIEGKPPANAIGNLYVLINGEEKNHYYCMNIRPLKTHQFIN